MRVTLELRVLGKHLGLLDITVADIDHETTAKAIRPVTRGIKKISRAWVKGMTSND